MSPRAHIFNDAMTLMTVVSHPYTHTVVKIIIERGI